jgi:hypothetical protein
MSYVNNWKVILSFKIQGPKPASRKDQAPLKAAPGRRPGAAKTPRADLLMRYRAIQISILPFQRS